MKKLYESIFTTNTKTISDAVSKKCKKWGYEDKGDYEQAYIDCDNNDINGYIIWPKSNKTTIHITSKMISFLQKYTSEVCAVIYICPIGGKKLYDKGDITLHFDSDLSNDRGHLFIVWGGSKKGTLTVSGGDLTLKELNIRSNDNIQQYPQITSIFDFIDATDKDRGILAGCLWERSDNKYDIILSSNITAHYIDVQGERSTTVTIYGIIDIDGKPIPLLDLGQAKLIDKSNNDYEKFI